VCKFLTTLNSIALTSWDQVRIKEPATGAQAKAGDSEAREAVTAAQRGQPTYLEAHSCPQSLLSFSFWMTGVQQGSAQRTGEPVVPLQHHISGGDRPCEHSIAYGGGGALRELLTD
jgi:hypothetical protein